jgi:hypothetical protein
VNIPLGLLDCGLSLKLDRLTKVMESVLNVDQGLIKAWIRPSNWCGLNYLNFVDRLQHPVKGCPVGNDSVGQDINRIFLGVYALSNALDDDGNPDQLIAGEPRQF